MWVVSALRNSPLREALVQTPMLSTLRRRLLPRRLTDNLKALWKIGVDPPAVPQCLNERLHELFDRDLARLGSWLGIDLECSSFHQLTASKPPSWRHLEQALDETLLQRTW